MEELVLIADLHKFVATALIVIKYDLELRDAFFALHADPVIDLFMWAIGGATCWLCAALKDLGRTTESLQELRLILCWSIKQWKRLRQEMAPIIQTLQTDL